MKYKHYIAVRDGLSEGFCYECGGGGDADYTIVKAKDAQHALDIAVSFFDADKLQYYDNPAQVHVYEMNPTSAASRTLDPPEPPERSEEHTSELQSQPNLVSP